MRLPLAPKSRIDFSGETDADLLGLMSLRDGDEDAARDAYAELFRRHATWLYSTICSSRMRNVVINGEEDVVQETFRRAYQGAETFRYEGPENSKSRSRGIRAWIGGIANNVICDTLRSHDCMDIALGMDNPDEFCELPRAMPSRQTELAREALDSLSDREKDVVLERLYHYKWGERHQRMPNEASSALAKRWNTTNVNIRAIYSRALKKIGARVKAGLSESERSA